MSRFIIVTQEKGGVGKTFLSVHLTSYLRKLGHTYRPVDFDVQAGLVSRIFPSPDSANLNPDASLISSGESRFPELMERVLKGQQFLVDCGANTGKAWDTLLNQAWPSLLDELAEAGVKITLIVPVASDEKSCPMFEHYKTMFPGATQIMVIVREFKDEQFQIPSHPKELTIELPLAPEKLFSSYRKKGLTIDQIATSADPELAFVRGFARGYLPQLHATFDRIKPHLLP